MLSKKAIGPVIATALLLVVAVVAVAGFNTWFNSYSSLTFTGVEQKGDGGSMTTGIETIVGTDLYFKNGYNENITINSVKVDGFDCNVTGNYSNGIKSLNISECIYNVTTNTPEIVVFTDESVFTKKIYLKSIPTKPIPIPNYFISVWNTSESGVTGSNQIQLPIYSGGEYNFTVIGTNLVDSPVHITDWTQRNLTFTSSGVHEINISGTIKGFRFNNAGDKDKIYDIKQWGILNIGNLGSYFYGCSNLIGTATDALNLTGTNNLYATFWNANSFQSDISNWDVSNVLRIDHMFRSANSFNIDISNWNVSRISNINYLFYTNTIFNQNLSNWDVSQVTDCVNFNSFASSWSLSNQFNLTEQNSTCTP